MEDVILVFFTLYDVCGMGGNEKNLSNITIPIFNLFYNTTVLRGYIIFLKTNITSL